MSELKRAFDLTWHHNPVVIVPCASGIVWTRQAGGLMCNHPVVEGVGLPLENEDFKHDLDHSEKLHIGCFGPGHITDEEADLFDAELKYRNIPLAINRERLGESQEAWLYVRFEGVLIRGEGAFVDFEGCEAILTWDNCD